MVVWGGGDAARNRRKAKNEAERGQGKKGPSGGKRCEWMVDGGFGGKSTRQKDRIWMDGWMEMLAWHLPEIHLRYY